MEPESRINEAIPIPQVTMPTNAREVKSPDWEHRTPCERTFIAIFLEHILPLMKGSNELEWQFYAIDHARIDDLVMTAMALLYSRHMNLSSVGRFAQLYQDHFAKLLSVRENTHLFRDDENHQTVVALLVVLLSQAGGPGSMFLETESKLLEILDRLNLRGYTSIADRNYHTAIERWILAEIELMKKTREMLGIGQERQISWLFGGVGAVYD
ncbi:hypothetical protein FVEG_14599 [Fusarium verticillioides 7600]|uniref:Transcription factor domain-containing protein n=1 Tax=Gibberella moniliformis (strain M3125 / FGSC 7600) TaxID=334819 RepID=W7LKL9_GIBM7|nr:hypothetical protein FVEG_14599 [Fusarium verticillioides 7600]EWG35994.1 hypothetical protein FVEG_14599 [Fusarium verticillioides 7600]